MNQREHDVRDTLAAVQGGYPLTPAGEAAVTFIMRLFEPHEHDWDEVFASGVLHEKCYVEGCEERRWRMRSDTE